MKRAQSAPSCLTGCPTPHASAPRCRLLPPFLANISPRTQTPLVAQMVLGVIIGAAVDERLLKGEL